MLRLAPRTYSVFLTECFVGKQNIFSRWKRTCFQLKIGLSTEAASFFLLGVFFASSYASNDMLKHVESEATLQKPLNR